MISYTHSLFTEHWVDSTLFAVNEGQKGIVQRLVSAGADVLIKDKICSMECVQYCADYFVNLQSNFCENIIPDVSVSITLTLISGMSTSKDVQTIYTTHVEIPTKLRKQVIKNKRRNALDRVVTVNKTKECVIKMR